MWLYLIIFAIPTLWYCFGSPKSHQSVGGLAVFLIFLAIFVGMSDMFGGYDRYIYGEVFDSVANGVDDGLPFSEVFMGFNEIGYMFYNYLVAHITANRYIFILLTTIIVYILLIIELKNYTDDYPFAVLLFLGLWFFFSFTYLRQVMAVTISAYGIKYAIDKKWLLFLLFVILAYQFHHSAIVLLLLLFTPKKKFKTSTIICIMAFCLLIGVSNIASSLFESYASIMDNNEKYAGYVDETESYGTRIDYIIESFFFLFIIIKQYKNIIPTRRNLVLLNYSLLFCAILLIFVRSPQAGRLSWYFILGLISFMTTIINAKKVRTSMNIYMIGIMLVLYVRILVGWDSFLFPYKTFLTNGVRLEDHLHDKYEYDTNYDNDKLYRPIFRIK